MNNVLRKFSGCDEVPCSVNDEGMRIITTVGSVSLHRSSVLSLFFLSSRRRHTRFDCDWSSDVCSSDLLLRFLERLAVDAERGHRARLQPLDADVRPALLALAVRAVVDAPERLVDLRDELALAVADAEEEVAVAFQRGAIGRVGELLAVLPHAVDGAGGFADELVAPLFEERAKRIEFALSHGELRGDRCSTAGGRTQSARRITVRIAYLDTFSGISGDMTVGALLDLGLPLDALREAITALALPGVEVAVERVARSGIAAAKFHVRVHGEHPDQGAPTHGHGHRAWGEIRDLLTKGGLAAPVKEHALAVFARLAEAEGRVHGVPADAVQFHEVGALDAIVDVVGAALGFVHLGVEAVYAGPLPMGQGRLRSAHGPLPVPAPAVVLLVAGRPVRLEDVAAELVTPTGAAIVAALAQREAVPEMRIEAVGYGAGDRELADRPNLLRILLGEPVDRKSTRLNSSHSQISYAVFCLKKKNKHTVGRAPPRALTLQGLPYGCAGRNASRY